MERTPKEWQSLVLRFKSRIAAVKELMESEYVALENQKKASQEVRKANSQDTPKP